MSQPPSKRSAATPAGPSPDVKRLKKHADASSSRDSDSGKPPKEKKHKEPNLDYEIQKQLLNNDDQLKRLFMQLAQEKPADMSNKEFAKRFWTARWYLIEDEKERQRQQKASSHVFSQLKTRRDEGGPLKLSITKEQVGQIFKQYPVVRRVYNDVVSRPDRPLEETQFWTRFFSSRLFKTLKGEPFTDHDPKDPEIDKDKYLNDESEEPPEELLEQHIPMFIDLQGNESNTKWKGNAPDQTMRPNRQPILHILNNMSEKILAHVAPNDGPAHAPIGMDEETYNELRLRDLAGDAEDDRVILNIRDQARLQGGSSQRNTSSEAQVYAKQQPTKLLKRLQDDLSLAQPASAGSLDLASIIGFTPNSAEDDDGGPTTDADGDSAMRSSRPPSVAAHIHNLLAQQEHLLPGDSLRSVTSQLPPTTRDNLILAHHTTAEFLHIFWSIFHTLPAGANPLRTELKGLLATLDNSVDVRIKDMAKTVEKERLAKLADMKREADEVKRRTNGRRTIKVDESLAGPGKTEVLALMAPIIRSIALAHQKFDAAVKESTSTL